MTVADLIAKLQSVDPRRMVVLSCDAEGNGYSPLHSCWEGAYKDGDAGLDKLTAEDKRAGFSDEDILEGEPAMIFTPE
jgi:hypothetical protein